MPRAAACAIVVTAGRPKPAGRQAGTRVSGSRTVIDEATIERAAGLLREAAPEAKVILFGSYGNGHAREDSDVDFMVVESEVESRRAEAKRLEDSLRPLGIRADVHVASEETFDYWAGTPGTHYYEAAVANGERRESSPMRSREHAESLLEKVAEDEYVIGLLLGDPNSPDDVIGFHTQQVIEKSLKAVLASRGVRYPHTHKIGKLMDLVRTSGVAVPEFLEGAEVLTPFGAEFRYGVRADRKMPAFDRAWAADCVKKTREWAEGLVREE